MVQCRPILPRPQKSNGSYVGLIRDLDKRKYDGIILAVAHDVFLQMGSSQIKELAKEKYILFDVKYAFPSNEVDGRL